ncbi:MAG: NapC/NirT family cytochrome c [Candidatus Marinimicrobia bacterium]|nr:NapC/NirT family cytochrome c [Candidatus Neomarinimicrobiota bacterium]
MDFFRRYIMFIQLLFLNWIGKIGVIVASTAFISFFILEGLTLIGIFRSTYTGIVTYFLIPMIFIAGLILLPFAWRKQKKDTGTTLQHVFLAKFEVGGVGEHNFWEKVVPVVGILTIVNVLFIVAAGSSAMHYMDESEFCGTACHTIMGPEWQVYSVSPHSKVPCVDCHIGEGVQALAKAKINGAWQAVAAMFDLYNKPIGTPIHNLRPAKETCGKCHWPEKHYGSKLVKIERYRDDENNTKQYTTLNLKVDAVNGVGSGIHWHISENNEVRYSSVDDMREDMIWVEVMQPNGTYKRYTNQHLADSTSEDSEPRVMDCVDCHNRATHIYEQPDAALDRAMARGDIDTDTPYIKREAMAAITTSYDDKDSALTAIGDRLTSFYEQEYPDKDFLSLPTSIEAVKAIYDRNIHPAMKIDWGTYPNHLGHRVEFGCFSCHNFMQHEQSDGCFRCHNRHLVDEAGEGISDECTLCHSILALGEENPLQYLLDQEFRSFEEHKNTYFREEYLKNF